MSGEPGAARLQLLSSGRYHAMVTAAGGGYSRWKGLARTRWREDAAGDALGAFCYLRDVDSGQVCSATRPPTLHRVAEFSASFPPGLATFRVRAGDIEVQTLVAVKAVDDVELRRLRVTDHSAACDAAQAQAQAVIVPDARLRADAAVIAGNTQGQAGPRRHAISGDLPIVLLLTGDPDHPDLAIAVYPTEPCVIASDVYALPPHTGRGGWTWHTGYAGWMLSFILELLTGLNVESDRLRIVPCIPELWNSFQVNYRFRDTLYRIEVLRATPDDDGPALKLDGAECLGPAIALVDDQREHAVVVRTHRTGDTRCRSA